jgi:hypothetical protein
MSLSLPEHKFALIVQSFAQEISIAISGYGGYVFKYEGDAVIALFPAEYDQVKACKNALKCSRAILQIIKEANEKSVRLMLNKRETVLSALVVVSVILVASSFAISFVQQALAQGSNMSSSGGNATSAGHKDNPTQSGGQMTGGGY